jgi:pimeloyl-ACP methyl ester carboxylesterase
MLLTRCLLPALLPRLGGAARDVTMMAASATRLPGDLLVREHTLQVPLDAERPRGETLDLFVRELVPASQDADESLPCLLYLQGGPGFPSGRPTCPPSGWQQAALSKSFRIFLLDQRGTGRSSPVTAQSLAALGEPAAQAEYLTYFRADSIVRDCELVRKELARGQRLTLLGQSFGGFCILSYLSLAPEGVERALFTFGLAPVGRTADEVYRMTYARMAERNLRFYERYPHDVELVRRIVQTLHASPLELPRGGTLTARRFLQLGLLLGSANGMETLHDLFELARCPPPPVADGRAGATGAATATATASSDAPIRLPDHFLLAVEEAQQQFETNPLYWLLHEAIYCDGPDAGASAWSAERVQAQMGDCWDYMTRLESGGPPVLLTGETVYSWMGDDYAWLRPLKPCAELLAAKTSWPPLYDRSTLGSERCPPVAALVSYEDIYVERQFSEETSRMLGPDGRTARLWITNEFQHSGLRDQPAVVFERLLKMAKGELAIPS